MTNDDRQWPAIVSGGTTPPGWMEGPTFNQDGNRVDQPEEP